METAASTQPGAGVAAWLRAQLVRLARGDDGWALGRVLAVLVLFVAIDRGTRAVARLDYADIDSWSLTVASLGRRPLLTALAMIAAAGLALWRPRRFFARWDALERGSALRWFTAAVVAVVIWRTALYDYNWLVDRWHGLDRGLVVVLGVAAVWRPVFLPALVVVARSITEQLTAPLGFESTANIQDLAVLVLVMVSAGFVLYVLTGDRRTDALPLLLVSVVAAHFWFPGWSKLRSGWVGDNVLENLPRSALAQGWGASGDGSRADRIADTMGSFRWGFVVGVLLVELGVLVALVHRNLIRLWLIAVIGFHVATFAVTGFVFLDWVIVEVALIALLSAPTLVAWVRRSFRPLRVLLVAAVLVLFVADVFHPPSLAWFDTPVTYRYEVEALVASGDALVVEPADLSPYVGDMAFSALGLGPSLPAVGGYGAASRDEFDRLVAFETLADLAEVEASLGEPTAVDRAASEFFLLAFVRASQRARPGSVPGPPHEFQIDLPGPGYGGQPIERLVVRRVTTVHDGEVIDARVEPVLEIAMVDGEPVLVG